MESNYKKIASIILQIIGAIGVVAVIITGAIYFATKNGSLITINFIIFTITSIINITACFLKPIKKVDKNNIK